VNPASGASATISATAQVELMRATEQLAAAGLADARLEAELLLAHLLGVTRQALYHDPQRRIASEAARVFGVAVARRARREPLQYITGVQEFWGLAFAVSPAVLIPRPETEHLVEVALERLPEDGARVLDLGTGSGCIAVALAAARPAIAITATDQSRAAIAIARGNARHHGLAKRIAFKAGDLFAPVAGERFDLIVSNPPYIPEAAIDRLQPEVARFEPRTALAGGADGLEFYRRLLAEAQTHLAPGGAVMIELGYGQGAAVTGLAEECGCRVESVRNDLAGIPRVMCIVPADPGATVWTR
jgi:release factor glutamine methyltransferase